MNGIEKITARIDAQTQEEIDRLLADAKRAGGQITAQYRAQAETAGNPDGPQGKGRRGRLEQRLRRPDGKRGR